MGGGPRKSIMSSRIVVMASPGRRRRRRELKEAKVMLLDLILEDIASERESYINLSSEY